MRAAQLFEDLVLIVLDAQAYAVKTLVVQRLQQRGGDAVGIGFEGDLRVRRNLKAPLELVENADQSRCAEKAGGAAAKIDGIGHIPGGPGASFLEMARQRLQKMCIRDRNYVICVLS